MNRDARRLQIVAALTPAPAPEPVFVAVLHGEGCLCARSMLERQVVGPFTNAHPLAMLAWAQTQCEAGVVARMLPPTESARTATGAR